MARYQSIASAMAAACLSMSPDRQCLQIALRMFEGSMNQWVWQANTEDEMRA